MFRSIFFLVVLLSFLSCKSYKQHIADTEVSNLRATPSSNQDNGAIAELIEPYKSKVNKEMEIVIGQLPMNLKKRRPNSAMGNWFADIMHDAANMHLGEDIDFAIQNYGGFRIPFLSKGPLTKGNIYELMPFDNKLIILSLDKSEVQMLCDMMAERGGWPMSRGLSYTISEEKASMVKINGEIISQQKQYLVALPDYIANGGGGGKFLVGKQQNDTGLYIRDLVIDHLQKMQQDGVDITIDSAKRIF